MNDEPDDACDSCSTNTECLPCLGDRIYQAEADYRLEENDR